MNEQSQSSHALSVLQNCRVARQGAPAPLGRQLMSHTSSIQGIGISLVVDISLSHDGHGLTSPQMNLGRYTVSTPANPTLASISFTESVPLAGPSRIADDALPAGKRKGKERETNRSGPTGGEGKKKRRSKRNGHFVIAGEEGFEVWSSASELRQLLRRRECLFPSFAAAPPR